MISLQDLKKDVEAATESTWSFVGNCLVDICSYAEYESQVRSLVSSLPAEVEVFLAPNNIKYIKISLKV
jgi:hypothetical protein